MRHHDAHALVAAVRDRVPAGSTDVHVLIEASAGGTKGSGLSTTGIPIERAVDVDVLVIAEVADGADLEFVVSIRKVGKDGARVFRRLPGDGQGGLIDEL